MSKHRVGLLEAGLWMIALLMLLLVLSPYGIGMLVRQNYPLMLENVARSLQGQVKVLQYDNGYFSSRIRYQLIFSPRAVFEFSEDIIHGPLYLGLINQGQSPFVAAVVQGRLLETHVPESIKPWLKNSEFIYQNVMDYNGDGQLQAYLPGHRQSLEYAGQPYQLDVAAITADARYESSAQRFSGELALPSISMHSAEQSLKARKLALSFMLLAGKGPWLEGDGLLSVQRFEFQSSKEQQLLENLIVQLQNQQQGDRLSLGSQINISRAYASNERFGPLAASLSIYDLDEEAMAYFIRGVREPGISTSQVIAAMLPALSKGASIELQHFDMDSDLGNLQASFLLSSEGIGGASADPLALLSGLNMKLALQVDRPLMEQMIAWQLQSYEAENESLSVHDKGARLEAAVPLRQKVAENLQGLVDENWLSFDKKVYRCTLEMSQGQAHLNQQPVDPLAHIMSQIQGPTAVQ